MYQRIKSMPHDFSMVSGDPPFTCRLQTMQCAFGTEPYNTPPYEGKSCSRTVTIGLPLCWQHMKIVHGVQVKQAYRNNTPIGKGLFATREFARDAWICPYINHEITEDELEARYPGDMQAPYAETNEGTGRQATTYHDAACVRGIAALANGEARKRDSNCTIEERGAPPGGTDYKLWLRARKRIKATDELIAHYGAEYFSTRMEEHTTKYISPKQAEKRRSSAPSVHGKSGRWSARQQNSSSAQRSDGRGTSSRTKRSSRGGSSGRTKRSAGRPSGR